MILVRLPHTTKAAILDCDNVHLICLQYSNVRFHSLIIIIVWRRVEYMPTYLGQQERIERTNIFHIRFRYLYKPNIIG
jgi:hypothetical protein